MLFAQENIDVSRLTDFSFASRKTPEYMCHRLVQCRVCDLVFVPDPPVQSELANAYHSAGYDSTEEANDAAASYIMAIQPVLSKLRQTDSALEIGTGTAIFLEHLQGVGFRYLCGVEPSTAAIEAAPPNRRAWIREGIFNGADFDGESFDLVCCFMTMEHVSDPRYVAEAVHSLLRPGGAFVTVTHDYRSLVNRLLGKRSPIIDIEHMQLFSEKSMRELMQRTGYAEVSSRAFSNRYSVQYWLRLMPLPGILKRAATSVTRTLRLGGKKITIHVGNMIAYGFKPASVNEN